MEQLSLDERIQRAHIALMGSKPFCLLSGIFVMGKRTTITAIPTAATDGYNVWYGEEFCMKQNDKQLNYVVLHENYHKGLKQLHIWKNLFKEETYLANMAADYVINYLIESADPNGVYIERPTCGALIDPAFAGMDTYEVFEALKKKRQNGQKGMSGKSGQVGTNGTSSNDVEIPQPGQGVGVGGAGGPMDSHEWEKALGVSKEEAKKITEQIDQAMRQGAAIAGRRGSGGDRVLDALMEPKVRWPDQLREFVKSLAKGRELSTWSRPNRRWMARGMYMPSSYSENVGEIAVHIDTSGSIGGPILARFISELVSLCREVMPEKIHVLYWDTQVVRHEMYSTADCEQIGAKTKPEGGGGTVLSCVTQYMSNQHIKPLCNIVFTDGYLGNDWGGSWPSPVLWMIVGNRSAEPPFGKKVNVSDDDE